MVSKIPNMEFSTGDWLKDPALSLCAPATRGVWIDLLSRMHEAGRSGELCGTCDQLARLARCSTADLALALTDLQTTGAAVVTERNAVVTVVNRRMKNESEERKAANTRQLRRRSKIRAGPVTEVSRERRALRRQTSKNVCISSKSLSASTSMSTSDVANENRKQTSTTTSDAQIRIPDSLIQAAIDQCNIIVKDIPLSRDPDQNAKDRSLLFKAVVLSQAEMSEAWLADSIQAVKEHPAVVNKMKYFHGVLRSKCEAQGQNFNRLLRRVWVPEQILKQ